MSKKIIVFSIAVLLLLAGFALFGFNQPSHNQIAGPAYLKSDAEDLKDTIVTPHLDQKIGTGKNILWCSTFQLAWNELCGLGGGPIKLKPPSDTAEIMNKSNVSNNDIDSASYVAKAGFVADGILDDIRRELNDKFHGQESPDLLNSVPDNAILIAYSYLFKNLPFENKFERMKGRLSFEGEPLECFGFSMFSHDYKLISQVRPVDYKNKDDFIIELITKSTDDRLILAKVKPGATLQDTVKAVQKRVADADYSKVAGAEKKMLYVPVMDFDILKKYEELQGRAIQSSNKRLDGMPINAALQSIRFRLDETGAVLKSEAEMQSLSHDEPSPESLEFVFDKPFLIMLQRTDSENPYFALWVGNTELLLPANIKAPN